MKGKKSMCYLPDWEGGVYYHRTAVDQTLTLLRARGYDLKEISFILSDKTKVHAFPDPEHAVTTALSATGTLVKIMENGGGAAPLIAGPLAESLAAVGAGGGPGGIIGALISVGIAQEQAKKCGEGIKKGGVVIGVSPQPGDNMHIRRLFRTDPSFLF